MAVENQKKSDRAAAEMAQRDSLRSQELEDIKDAHEKLKAENEDYKRTLEFVISGPCLIGLRGYDSGQSMSPPPGASANSD